MLPSVFALSAGLRRDLDGLPPSVSLFPGFFPHPGATMTDFGQIIQLAGTGNPPPVLSPKVPATLVRETISVGTSPQVGSIATDR